MEKTEVFFWRTRINQEKSFSFQEKACCSGQTGENPKIESEGMNCDLTTRDIIVKDKIFWPNGLIIGYEEEAIFWTDTKMTMEYSESGRFTTSIFSDHVPCKKCAVLHRLEEQIHSFVQ